MSWLSRYRFLSIYACVIFLLVCLPLFSTQAMVTENQDILFHMNRIEGIKEGLIAGQFPVRIHAYQLDGYGYPCGYFYPDLFLYFPAVLRLLGIPMGTAYNLFLLSLNVLTWGVSYYAFSWLFRHRYPGMLAACFYLTCGYRILDVFVRGAMGEILAMAFLPLAFVSVYEVLFHQSKQWYWIVLSFTCILQSHLLSGWMCCAYAVAMVLVAILCKKDIPWKRIRQTMLWGLGLNFWFYFPFLDLYRQWDFNMQHALSPIQQNGLSGFEVGLYLLLTDLFLLMGWLLYFLSRWMKKKEKISFLTPCVVLSVFLTLMVLRFFPWDLLASVPGVRVFVCSLQFPWRLWEDASVCFSIIAAAGAWFWIRQGGERKKLAVLTVFFLTGAYFQVQVVQLYPYTLERDEAIPSSNRRSIGYQADYLSYGLDEHVVECLSSDFVMEDKGKGNVVAIWKRGSNIEMNYDAVVDTVGTAALLYYPGYVAKDEGGNPLPVYEDSRHLLEVQLPAGQHHVKIYYAGLMKYHLAEIFSLLVFVFFCRCLWGERRRIRMIWSEIP